MWLQIKANRPGQMLDGFADPQRPREARARVASRDAGSNQKIEAHGKPDKATRSLYGVRTVQYCKSITDLAREVEVRLRGSRGAPRTTLISDLRDCG